MPRSPQPSGSLPDAAALDEYVYVEDQKDVVPAEQSGLARDVDSHSMQSMGNASSACMEDINSLTKEVKRLHAQVPVAVYAHINRLDC